MRAAPWLLAAALAAPQVLARPIALPSPGSELYAPSRQCYAKVLADRGERLRARLYVRDRLVRDFAGAREMVWIGEVLVFASSPASGKPGIYAWDCPGGSVRRIVVPSRATREHPGGTDVFQLVEVDGDTLYYAHAPDVDSPSLAADLERGIETLRLRAPRPRISMR